MNRNIANPTGMPNMNLRPRLNTLACCVGAALASMIPGASLADSGVGVDTALGNVMNPAPNASRSHDPDWPAGKRTPTGQLYDIPYAPAGDPQKTATGWEYSGQAEIGVLGGNANLKNDQFRQYKDLGNGLYVNNFGLQAEKPDGARFVEITGGGVGKDDQYYGLQLGRYNDWKVKAFYSETPHVFTSNYGTIWDGVGTGNLTLKAPLRAGGSNPAAVGAAAIAAAASVDNTNVKNVSDANTTSLSITRKKGGVRYDLNLSSNWKGYASYSLEHREGARPFGMVWGGGGGTAPVEVAEPVDHKTHDLLAGLQYADALNNFNLQLSASLFRNSIDTLTVQEPYTIQNATGMTGSPFTQGRFDLHPSNEAYKVKADYARSLPDFYKGRFTATASLGTHRQNDNLIPYTPNSGVTLANVTGNNWDSTASLSRQSAGAKIDTKLVDLGLALNPTDALNVKGKFRYYENDNKINPFLACNPVARYVDTNPNTAGNQAGGLTADGCTGVWGRVLNDGSGSSVLMGASSTRAGNLPIMSIPFEYKQFNVGLGADYRLNRVSSVNAAYERETYHREHREREKTWEDKLKLGYVNRGLADSTVRLSYEYGNRRGDEYHTEAYEEFVSAALVPMPTAAGSNVASWAVHMNDGIRKLDIADRKRHIVNGRFNTMLRPDLDAGFMLQLKFDDYPESNYGRQRQTQQSVNFDLNYQASATQSIYGFFSYQSGQTKLSSIASTGTCNLGQVTALGTITRANASAICAAPGGPLFPFANQWTVRNKDHNNVLGLGLKQNFSKTLLSLNFTRSLGRSDVNYDYTAGGAITAANAPFAGSGMPPITTVVNMFDASLLVPVSRQVGVRLIYRYESGKIRDWHYQGLDASPVAAAAITSLPTALILDGGPQDYKASVIGIMLRIAM